MIESTDGAERILMINYCEPLRSCRLQGFRYSSSESPDSRGSKVGSKDHFQEAGVDDLSAWMHPALESLACV